MLKPNAHLLKFLICMNVGGLNPNIGIDNEHVSSRELRRSRMDLLYKDYEVCVSQHGVCARMKFMGMVYPVQCIHK